jgi:hypothetical protein
VVVPGEENASRCHQVYRGPKERHHLDEHDLSTSGTPLHALGIGLRNFQPSRSLSDFERLSVLTKYAVVIRTISHSSHVLPVAGYERR